MNAQYMERKNELMNAWLSGVDKANEYRSNGDVSGFIAQVRENQATKTKMEAARALMMASK